MEELLPFIFFVVWLLFGGLGAKKKREQAQRRGDSDRTRREAAAQARAERMRAAREAEERFGTPGRSTPGPRQPSAGAPAPPRSSTEQPSGTALDMVPDELWAILTGGAPRPTGPSAPQRPPEQTAEGWPTAGPEQGGWTTEPPWDEEDAIHSIEGVSAEQIGENELDYDDLADATARARYEDPRPTRQVRPSHDDAALLASETSDARHFAFHDRLTEGEIGAARPVRPSAMARLGLNHRTDVRRAIVLAEVLGPPVSLR